jgi:Tol biopolymer transport system component
VTVSAPPRPRLGDPVDRDELEALVNALIEEARRRARRRRLIYAAIAAAVALVGSVLLIVFAHGAQSRIAPPAVAPRTAVAGGAARSRIAFIGYPRFGPMLRAGQLWVANADGTGKRFLAASWYSRPTWPADGQKIAYEARNDIWAMNLDTNEQQNLTNSRGADIAPVWSPDGRRIAFLRYPLASLHEDGWDVYVMSADGSARQRLARHAAIDFSPVWSHGGRRLAFASRRDGNLEIYTVNTDGSGLRRLTHNKAGDRDPAWSPDGRRIAFASQWQLAVMNADGSGQRILSRSTGRDFAPDWSPDGRRIAFERQLGRHQYSSCPRCGRAARFEVHLMNADGTAEHRLTANGMQPRWSPDGRKIGFVSGRDGSREVYVMNGDGSGQRNVSHTRLFNDSLFAWSPGSCKELLGR